MLPGLLLFLFVLGRCWRGGVGVGFGGEDGWSGGRFLGGGGCCFGGSEEASVGSPGGRGGSGVGVGGLDVEGSDGFHPGGQGTPVGDPSFHPSGQGTPVGDPGLAGVLEEVEGAGLEGEGVGLGEVDAGVLKLAVDEERDGDEACGGGVGEGAGPLVDGDGAGDLGGGGGVVGLGVEVREPECGDKEEAADGGPEMHACDVTSDETSDLRRAWARWRTLIGFAMTTLC